MKESLIGKAFSRRTALAVLSVSVIAGASMADEQANNIPAEPDRKLVQKIEEELEKLGGDTWKKREAAQATLMDLGREHNDILLDAALDVYLETIEPEIKLRVRKLVKELVLELDFQEDRAFLGVRLQDSAPLTINGKAYRPVLIGELIADEAAEKNGFRAGDKILKVDKHVCDGTFATAQLITYIRGKTPGTKMTYTLFAGGKEITRTVVLGERPVLPGEAPMEQQKKVFVKSRYQELLVKARKRAKEAKELAHEEGRALE